MLRAGCPAEIRWRVRMAPLRRSPAVGAQHAREGIRGKDEAVA